MKRIFIPTEHAGNWQRLLAEPHKHWKPGRSAMSAAAAWEDAPDSLPPEIVAALEAATDPALADLRLLAAIPEWEVALPGGTTTSHTDVLAVARNDRGLVVLAVEAKVDEPFGPTVGEKRADASEGQRTRLDYLQQVLGLPTPVSDDIRYQLLHRTASAILTAHDFHAAHAVMLVQSFGSLDGGHQPGWEDFAAFGRALGASVEEGRLVAVPRRETPNLFLGWCAGDQRFRSVDLRDAK